MTDWKQAEHQEMAALIELPKVSKIRPDVHEKLLAHFSEKPPLKNHAFELISDVRQRDRSSECRIPFFRLNTAGQNGAHRKARRDHLLIEFHRIYPYGRDYGREGWDNDAYDKYKISYEVAFVGQSLIARIFKTLERIRVDFKVLNLGQYTDESLIDEVAGACIDIIESNAHLLDTK